MIKSIIVWWNLHVAIKYVVIWVDLAPLSIWNTVCIRALQTPAVFELCNVYLFQVFTQVLSRLEFTWKNGLTSCAISKVLLFVIFGRCLDFFCYVYLFDFTQTRGNYPYQNYFCSITHYTWSYHLLLVNR